MQLRESIARRISGEKLKDGGRKVISDNGTFVHQ